MMERISEDQIASFRRSIELMSGKNYSDALFGHIAALEAELAKEKDNSAKLKRALLNLWNRFRFGMMLTESTWQDLAAKGDADAIEMLSAVDVAQENMDAPLAQVEARLGEVNNAK